MTELRVRAAVAALCMGIAGLGCQRGHDAGPAPTAAAGADQAVAKGARVVLDGSASAPAAPGSSLQYRWTQTAGAPVVLADATSTSPSFQAPRVSGTLTFSLVVTADGAASRPDTVDVRVVNQAPIADAGADLMIRSGNVATLSGRASHDPDGDPLAYDWVQSAGPAVALTPRPDGTARFIAPDAGSVLEFSLIVSDGEERSLEDLVRITVVLPGQNLPPQASAGPDLTVARRSVVSILGSGSDPDGTPVTYAWTQTSGPTVELLTPGDRTLALVAPEVECDLELELEVSDGVDVATDRVAVHVRNAAPQVAVSIGPASPGTLDDLVATANAIDPDGDVVSVAWRWYRNGILLPDQAAATLPSSETTKGDVFRAVATGSDGVATAEGEATVTIRDTPPVLSAPALVEVAWGERASFTVSVDDPDGDPAPAGIALTSGPSGLAIGPGGEVSWTAVLPMFDRTLDVHWSAAIPGVDGAAFSGVFRVTDPDREYPLRRSGIEAPGGPSRFQAIDLDADGVDELLVAGRTGLYALGRSGAGYAPRWMYPFSPGASDTVGAVAARDLDGDGRPEIVFSTGKRLVELDGVARRELARLDTTAACVGLELVDVDADGAIELVCLAQISDYGSTYTVSVLDAVTLAVEWASEPLALGGALAVGDVDGDHTPEVVTAAGWVFDGKTGENEWAYGPGFGVRVDTGDLDGDGVEEIVGMADWYAVRGYSAVAKSPLWEQSASDLDALLVADVDGDGLAEVVTGAGQWGSVTGYDYDAKTNALAPRFTIDSQDHGVSALALGDLDGDGGLELAWGTGLTSSGEDLLVVAGLGVSPPIAIEWKNVGPSQLDGPFVGARPARLGDGREAILFATPTTDSSYGGLRLVALDPATGAWTLSPELGTNWNEAAALDVADYDRDGADEALLLTSATYDGYFTAYDVARSAAEWTSATGVGTGRAVTHADLNGDGDDELVAITAGGYVSAYDPKHQTQVWTSTSLGSGADVAVADLDGDGALEIVAAAGGRVVAYHRAASGPVPYVEHASASVAGVFDLVVADCDGDGAPEVHALGGSGSSYSGQTTVTRLDGDLQVLSTFTTGEPLQALFVEDLGAGRKNLVGATGPRSYGATTRQHLVALDPVSGAEVWRSPDLWGTVGLNSLSYVGTAAAPAIAFGTGSSMYVTR